MRGTRVTVYTVASRDSGTVCVGGYVFIPYVMASYSALYSIRPTAPGVRQDIYAPAPPESPELGYISRGVRYLASPELFKKSRDVHSSRVQTRAGTNQVLPVRSGVWDNILYTRSRL